MTHYQRMILEKLYDCAAEDNVECWMAATKVRKTVDTTQMMVHHHRRNGCTMVPVSDQR